MKPAVFKWNVLVVTESCQKGSRVSRSPTITHCWVLRVVATRWRVDCCGCLFVLFVCACIVCKTPVKACCSAPEDRL